MSHDRTLLVPLKFICPDKCEVCSVNVQWPIVIIHTAGYRLEAYTKLYKVSLLAFEKNNITKRHYLYFTNGHCELILCDSSQVANSYNATLWIFKKGSHSFALHFILKMACEKAYRDGYIWRRSSLASITRPHTHTWYMFCCYCITSHGINKLSGSRWSFY